MPPAVRGMGEGSNRATGMLLGLGAMSALAYGVVFTLRFPFTRFPGLPTQIPNIAPGVAQAMSFAVGWLVLFALYYAAFRLSPLRYSRRHVLIAMGFAVLFGTLMVATYPIASTDVFDYVGRAHFITDRGGNPLLVSPASVGQSYPFLHYITSVGVASPYGPLWQEAGSMVARVAGQDATANMLGMKALTMAAYLAGMPLVYMGLRRFDPQHALRGLILYGWCPAAMFEFGAEGHNDALLVLCLVLAVFLLVSMRPGWAAVAVMAAALVKFSPLVIIPLFLLAALRMPSTRAGRVRAAVGGTVGAAALCAAAYAPFGIEGFRATVSTLVSRGDLRANSPSWALGAIVHDLLGTPDAGMAQWVVRVGLLLVAATVLWGMSRLVGPRAVPAEQVPRQVLLSSFAVLGVLLFLAVPFFWPWYILWLAAFVSALRERGVAGMFTAFACGGFAIPCLTAYYGLFLPRGYPAAVLLLAFGPAAVVAAGAAVPRLRGGLAGAFARPW